MNESDYISRKALMEALRNLPHEYGNREQRARTGGIAACQFIVSEMPAVNPQEPKPKIFKAASMAKPEAMEKYRRQIIKQMEEGVVMLPYWIEVVEDRSDLLDKIRAEIEELYGKYVIRHCVLYGPNPKYIPLAEVLQIIDKYKAESEG